MFPCLLQVECLLVEGVLEKRNLVYCASTRYWEILHSSLLIDNLSIPMIQPFLYKLFLNLFLLFEMHTSPDTTFEFLLVYS